MSKPRGLGLKEVRVHMGTFDFTVICCVGPYKSMSKYIAWKFEDEGFDVEGTNFGYAPRGKCFFRHGYVPVIWIPKKPSTVREHTTLSHECLHAVFHLFEWADLPLTRDTEEVMAHAQAHLTASILEKI